MRQCLSQPFQVGVVILEKHGFLAGEVPEERPLGDAGFGGQLRHRHIGEPLAGELCQRYPT